VHSTKFVYQRVGKEHSQSDYDSLDSVECFD